MVLAAVTDGLYRLLYLGHMVSFLVAFGELLLWAGQSSRSRSQPTSIVLTDRWTASPSGAIAAG